MQIKEMQARSPPHTNELTTWKTEKQFIEPKEYIKKIMTSSVKKEPKAPH